MFCKQQKILLKDKLKDIKYKNLHQQIYNILKEDNNFKHSINKNGVYFDINLLNDDTLNKINELLQTMKDKNNDKLEYKPYFIEEYNNNINIQDGKLNNILKKLNI